jgi:hypothetical protein
MRDLIRGTWLATELFVAPLALFEWSLASISPGLAGSFSVGALLITPAVWWWLVARRRTKGPLRGALTGALCAALILLVPTVRDAAIFAKRASSPEGGFSAASGFTFLVGSWVVGIPIGVCLGALAVFVESAKAQALARRAH